MRSFLAAMLLCGLLAAVSPAGSQSLQAAHAQRVQVQQAEKSALDWVNAAVQYQLAMVSGDGQYMRYLQQRQDQRGSQLRDVVETREGFVSRIIRQSGQPLTAAQNANEIHHLQGLLSNPDELAKHHKREQTDLDTTKKLIAQMPTAMLWTLVPAETTPDTVVVDYKANPDYHPPSMDCAVLKALSGRLWIDAHTGRMMKIEAHLVRDSDYGWGLLVHINSGGTVLLEQRPVDPDNTGHPHWETTRFEMHVTGTMLLVRHLNFDIIESHDHFTVVHGAPSYADGIRLLLDAPKQ